MASNDYLKLHWDNGGTSEFDPSINEISRAKITALKSERGGAWLYKMNVYDLDLKEDDLVEYTGQNICNFAYDGAVPEFDQVLYDLLKDYHADSGYKSGTIWQKIEAIQNRVDELNGVFLQWA